MKIHDMVSKTSLEVDKTDLLLIEDDTDTKSITIEEFLSLINGRGTKNLIKELVNSTLDKIIQSLEDGKFIIDEDRFFLINSWIGSTSGNIQIALKEIGNENEHWLTQDEINELLALNEDGTFEKELNIQLLLNDIYHNNSGYRILDYNTEHLGADNINEHLSNDNAGFIKVHFDGLNQNQISQIRYDNIQISLKRTEEYIYHFVLDENSFANNVEYIV